jgi:multidrug efflux pump subunit AcrA (membrane-fusion protein)
MRALSIFFVAAGLFAGTTGCEQSTMAGGDHQHAHGHEEHGHEEEHHAIGKTAFTPEHVVYVEFEPPVSGEDADFHAHITRRADGEPIAAGVLTLELAGSDGEPQQLTAAAPEPAGLWHLHATVSPAGDYKAKLSLQHGGHELSFDLGTLTVHASEAEADAAAEAVHEAHEAMPDTVDFTVEQQWRIRLTCDEAARRTLTQRLEVPGEIAPPRHSSAAVTAPVAGRLLPPPNAKLPVVGDRVEAGQVLAMIEPPLPATEAAALSANRAQLQALETELVLKQLDLEVRGLEVSRSVHQAAARLEFAQRAFERARELKEKGVGSDQQFDEAHQNLRIAQAEHDAALVMQQHYEQAAKRLTSMQNRLREQTTDRSTRPDMLQLELRSPISGVISRYEAVEGEHINTLEEVFYVVDLETVWVHAEVSEFDLANLTDAPNAHVTLPAYPAYRVDVFDAGGHLLNIGTHVAPQARTVRVIYELPNPDGRLRAGMFAEVALETQRASEAVAIHEDAIVLDNGKPVAFVQLEGEVFQKRELTLGIRDGALVEVQDGIAPGERVVTRGAYAVKLASLSPASFGHGHVH